MAWGYWSATTISDRGRSPRRNQNGTAATVASHSVPVVTTLEIERPCVSQTYSTASTVINSNNNNPQQIISDYEVATGLSRRPSLDLGSLGPQGALAGILCAAHGSRQQQQLQGAGTLSAGNTLTRVGSRHTAVEYAVPHHFHHHHAAAAYIEYHHQAQLSFSDDDSSSEPGYATGSDAWCCWLMDVSRHAALFIGGNN